MDGQERARAVARGTGPPGVQAIRVLSSAITAAQDAPPVRTAPAGRVPASQARIPAATPIAGAASRMSAARCVSRVCSPEDARPVSI